MLSSRPQTAEPTDGPANDELDRIEQRAMLYRSVGKLPADQRRVIVMRFAEDKSIREIAGELGKSEGAIKQLQFRGIQNLRAQLGQSHG